MISFVRTPPGGTSSLAVSTHLFMCINYFVPTSSLNELRSTPFFPPCRRGFCFFFLSPSSWQVVIKYVPYVGDSKRALDEYTSEIFMGGKNTISMHNTCEDSLLASPLIFDLVIMAELCERIQVCGACTAVLHRAPPVCAVAATSCFDWSVLPMFFLRFAMLYHAMLRYAMPNCATLCYVCM